MPWVFAELRGKRIYARADAGGSLVAESGLVEVRYKPNDGRRYSARVANLTVVPGSVMPDDACGPAEVVTRKDDASASSAASAASARGARTSSASASPPPVASTTGGIVAYGDGACSGNPGPAGSGVVVVYEGRVIERSEWLGSATNNVAELTAILLAVEETKGLGSADAPPKLDVYTDSQYSIGVLQKGWKAKANGELVAKVKAAVIARGARLHYVKGHAGHPLNERADELARQAVSGRRSQRTERVSKSVSVSVSVSSLSGVTSSSSSSSVSSTTSSASSSTASASSASVESAPEAEAAAPRKRATRSRAGGGAAPQ